ncbi:MAG: helix-turn-helix transcriptional regulator [Clostridia bacterium]|nr:helix-turn-helix transcriptional regulator [Clostridia bacterium]
MEHLEQTVQNEQDIEMLYNLSELYKVFGDSTRIRILYELLRCEELCVFHLAERLSMGQSAISHQLRILRGAGLVRPRREGKTVFYSLDDDHVREIIRAGMDHLSHG